MVRTVPQQREVVRGRWKNQAVYAKKFIGARAKKHFARDVAGVHLLTKANIATPALLFEGEADDNGFVAIFVAIAPSQNAEVAYEEFDKNARFFLMQQLVKAVAQHHQAGLIQTDLYLKNFLVQEEVVYTLDGDGIRRLPGFFQKQQRVRNLATLFSKMDALEDQWIPQLYRHYCQCFGDRHDTVGESEVWYLTQKIRHQVAGHYADKKVFRSCTDVKVMKNFKCFQAVSSDFGVENQALVSLDQFLADAKLNIKNGNTCTIGKAALANQSVVIKRYNIKSFWHGLSRAFRVSRAAKSWANAYRLIISNIATAKPLALVEVHFGWLRRRAYYLSEYIDAPDVMQFFAQSTKLEDRQAVARNLAILFYKLYLLKFTHGDFKATNIKIVNFAPVLIDLDGLQAYFGNVFGDWWFERKHVKDLKRFMQNWAHDVETTALLRQAFALQYTSQRADDVHRVLFRAEISPLLS